MLFKEYRDIVLRINRLDKPLSSLTKFERNEVLNLSIRQEEIEKILGDQIRSSFKELQEGLDVVAEWVKLMKEDAIKALGVEGTPEEVLALEDTLAQASLLNAQIASLTLANYSTISKNTFSADQEETLVQETQQNIAPVQDIRKQKTTTSLPVIHSTIDMIENSERKKLVTKVLEELNESVLAAAPTYSEEVFNQPRIISQKNKPTKKKKR